MNENKDPRISVIVPVYKVEAYLDRCVKSILDQTFEDFELILVDDGSPDNCPALCDAWAEKDSRIKVIHKENGGLSDARNVGFAVAEGEWIAFIDSDDYVHPAMLEALYNAVMQTGAKVSACGFSLTHGEALAAVCGLQGEAVTPEVFYREYGYSTIACAKLYARGCFETIRYPKGKLHEDEYVTYRILFACEKIAVVDAPLYGYFENQQGITKGQWSPKRLDAMEAFEQQITFFTRRGDEKLRRWRIWEYMKWILDQLRRIEEIGGFPTEKKLLEKAAKSLLRRSMKDGMFTQEKYLWICAKFYPRSTRVYSLWLTVMQKLGLKRK